MLSGFRDRLTLLRGRVPSCEWVEVRLPAYGLWDVSLSAREFGAIESHLQLCSKCSAEYERVHETQLQLEAMALGKDVAALDREAEAMAGRVLARVHEAIENDAGRAHPWSAVIRQGAVALSAVALVVAVGIALLWAVSNDDSGLAQQAALQGTTEPVPGEASAEASAEDVAFLPSESNEADLKVLETSTDAILTAAVASAQVDALLPHTEAEYESWAREAYPHILWLHDLLIDPEDGLDWEPRAIERFAASHPPGSVFTEASLGWRKLLIDSGEAFRFDYPGTPETPNCRPSVQGIRAAAAVAGYALELNETGRWRLPDLAYDDGDFSGKPIELALLASLPELPELPITEAPADYAETLVASPSLATHTLAYLNGASALAGHEDAYELASAIRSTLVEFHLPKVEQCDLGELRAKVESVLASREEFLRELSHRRPVWVATLDAQECQHSNALSTARGSAFGPQLTAYLAPQEPVRQQQGARGYVSVPFCRRMTL